MSKGFNGKHVPRLVQEGIECAFQDWSEMAGDWLGSAPEYFVTVRVAQNILKSIEKNKRTLWLEPNVRKVIAEAGGVQRGPVATKLRSDGRFDIVLGHGNGLPRCVIEIKSPGGSPSRGSICSDLNRLCLSLLNGKHESQIHSAVLGIYAASSPPKKIDSSAGSRLQRIWVEDWRKVLQNWEWKDAKKRKFSKHLKIDVDARITSVSLKDGDHAWAAIAVRIWKKAPHQQ